MVTKENLDNLAKLSALLKTVPPERFYYGSWVGDDWAGRQDLSCGTTACALGWATQIPEFKLSLHERNREPFHASYPETNYTNEHGWRTRADSAICELFGEEAMYLFYPDQDIDCECECYETVNKDCISENHFTAVQVAERIDSFIKVHEANQ